MAKIYHVSDTILSTLKVLSFIPNLKLRRYSTCPGCFCFLLQTHSTPSFGLQTTSVGSPDLLLLLVLVFQEHWQKMREKEQEGGIFILLAPFLQGHFRVATCFNLSSHQTQSLLSLWYLFLPFRPVGDKDSSLVCPEFSYTVHNIFVNSSIFKLFKFTQVDVPSVSSST